MTAGIRSQSNTRQSVKSMGDGLACCQ